MGEWGIGGISPIPPQPPHALYEVLTKLAALLCSARRSHRRIVVPAARIVGAMPRIVAHKVGE